MHFVRSREPMIKMKTKKANFCTQAATLAPGKAHQNNFQRKHFCLLLTPAHAGGLR